jgi:hypothetical protein
MVEQPGLIAKPNTDDHGSWQKGHYLPAPIIGSDPAGGLLSQYPKFGLAFHMRREGDWSFGRGTWAPR